MKKHVAPEEIQRLLDESSIITRTEFGKVTVVIVRLKNGFVLTESSGAVDPANYDLQTGKEICLERIKNRLWELEGYALSKKISGG